MYTAYYIYIIYLSSRAKIKIYRYIYIYSSTNQGYDWIFIYIYIYYLLTNMYTKQDKAESESIEYQWGEYIVREGWYYVTQRR